MFWTNFAAILYAPDQQISLHPAFLARRCIIFVFIACAIAQAQSPTSGGVQSDPSHVFEALDRDVPAPVSTGILGISDSAALSEIIAHVKVVGASPWAGIQGTGQITYGSESTSYSATLTIIGNTQFRLDGQTSNGMLSIRIDGEAGKIQESNGREYPLLPDTAASGIFQFELPRVANFPDSSTSLVDHGTAIINGSTLHRMTFEFPTALPEENEQRRRTVATDLYFDSTTHFLMKSANLIRINGAGNHDFLRVVTYEDYRKVGNSMIPFRFTQTLNGQKQWILQLSDVQLNPAVGFIEVRKGGR